MLSQWNREPLWTSGYTNTTANQIITKLNTVSNVDRLALIWILMASVVAQLPS